MPISFAIVLLLLLLLVIRNAVLYAFTNSASVLTELHTGR